MGTIHDPSPDDQLAAITQIVQRVDLYIDTVELLVPHKFRGVTRNALAPLCRARPFPPKRADNVLSWPWHDREVLTGPTEAAFALLDDLGLEHLVARVDFAADFIMENPDDVALAHAFVWPRWTALRQRAAHLPWSEYDTRYSAPFRTATVLASYPDQSRYTGEWCLHLDYRRETAASVRSLGVQSIADLLNYDQAGLWQRVLVLEDVPPLDLFRAYRNAAGATRRLRRLSPRYDRHLAGRRILRAMHWNLYGHSDPLMPAKVLRDYMLRYPEGGPFGIPAAALKGVLNRLDTAPLLARTSLITGPTAKPTKYQLLDQALSPAQNSPESVQATTWEQP